MRKHLYLIVFVFYFLVLGVILYANGVFTGSVTSYSNLYINLGFLAVIGILLVRSAISLIRLNQCTSALQAVGNAMDEKYDTAGVNLWGEYRNKKDLFHHPLLDEAYRRYQQRVRSNSTKKGVIRNCDLEEYINEDLLDQIGAAHYNSNIPGAMTGLGILGTFIGLSLGLGSFQGNDILTIADNIAPLLDGMKVAFHTSIYGILFSLLFSFVYRSIMAHSYDILREFLLSHREFVMPPVLTSTETDQALLVYQANIANSMKSIQELLKGNATDQTQALERIVQEFSHRLALQMGTDFEKLGSALQQAGKVQQLQTENFQHMTTSAKELTEASRLLMDGLNHTLKRQELFSQTLEQQQQQISQTCSTLSEDISNQLYTFQQMRDLYEK